MKGSYVLIIRIPKKREIRSGKLGRVEFMQGFYAYVGSAMNRLESRIRRHLSREKTNFWHIDYLLDNARIVDVIIVESSKRIECRIAGNLANEFRPVSKFGSSDCKCNGHLFYLGVGLPSHLAKVIKPV